MAVIESLFSSGIKCAILCYTHVLNLNALGAPSSYPLKQHSLASLHGMGVSLCPGHAEQFHAAPVA